MEETRALDYLSTRLVSIDNNWPYALWAGVFID